MYIIFYFKSTEPKSIMTRKAVKAYCLLTKTQSIEIICDNREINIKEFPTIIFLDENDNEIKRLVGFQTIKSIINNTGCVEMVS